MKFKAQLTCVAVSAPVAPGTETRVVRGVAGARGLVQARPLHLASSLHTGARVPRVARGAGTREGVPGSSLRALSAVLTRRAAARRLGAAVSDVCGVHRVLDQVDSPAAEHDLRHAAAEPSLRGHADPAGRRLELVRVEAAEVEGCLDVEAACCARGLGGHGRTGVQRQGPGPQPPRDPDLVPRVGPHLLHAADHGWTRARVKPVHSKLKSRLRIRFFLKIFL